jgi:hypothetical protein
VQQYQLTKVVCDPAAGGLGFYQGFNSQYGGKLGVTIQGANKVDKKGRVAIANSELRTGRLKLLRPAADSLAKELQTLRYRNRESCEFLTSKKIRDEGADTLMYCLAELMPIAAPPFKPASETVSTLDRIFNRSSGQAQTVKDLLV